MKKRVRRQRSGEKHIKQLERTRSKKTKRAFKIAASAEIRLLPNIPKTREELNDRILASPYRNSGMICFFRHELTNYDDVISNISKRQGYRVQEVSDRLKKKVVELMRVYIRDLKAQYLLTYRTVGEFKQVKK